MKTFNSDLSNNEFPITERVCGGSVRKSILDLIQQEHPKFTTDNFLANSKLAYYSKKYIEGFLSKQIGELTELEKKVLESLKEKTTLTDKIGEDDVEAITFGQRIADKVAIFGGSWTFLLLFGLFFFIWIALNLFWFSNKTFDPYPFILLNLILYSLSAIQAPIILMSQNRQEEKDRERAKKDYMVNLKSELEIRMLHEKIDHLIIHQQQEVLDIQKAQIEKMNEILKEVKKK